jgi:hypothetical protein
MAKTETNLEFTDEYIGVCLVLQHIDETINITSNFIDVSPHLVFLDWDFINVMIDLSNGTANAMTGISKASINLHSNQLEYLRLKFS